MLQAAAPVLTRQAGTSPGPHQSGSTGHQQAGPHLLLAVLAPVVAVVIGHALPPRSLFHLQADKAATAVVGRLCRLRHAARQAQRKAGSCAATHPPSSASQALACTARSCAFSVDLAAACSRRRAGTLTGGGPGKVPVGAATDMAGPTAASQRQQQQQDALPHTWRLREGAMKLLG